MRTTRRASIPVTGWFLAEGLLTAAQARALPNRLNDLCHRLLPGVAGLTDLMETPRAALQGPLAGPDYVSALTEHPPPARRSARPAATDVVGTPASRRVTPE
ncbi:hypothetical protein [Kitasatospora sp. NPDC047058]|uniref:hypothetical protein n=1 Tax=Kitasatospora sp. NPDC047058 TaxID=3155620 RepID=UPI0034039223